MIINDQQAHDFLDMLNDSFSNNDIPCSYINLSDEIARGMNRPTMDKYLIEFMKAAIIQLEQE